MLKGSIIIKEQSEEPATFSVEYVSDNEEASDKIYWYKPSLEATLAADISMLVRHLLADKNPADLGYCPF